MTSCLLGQALGLGPMLAQLEAASHDLRCAREEVLLHVLSREDEKDANSGGLKQDRARQQASAVTDMLRKEHPLSDSYAAAIEEVLTRVISKEEEDDEEEEGGWPASPPSGKSSTGIKRKVASTLDAISTEELTPGKRVTTRGPTGKKLQA